MQIMEPDVIVADVQPRAALAIEHYSYRLFEKRFMRAVP